MSTPTPIQPNKPAPKARRYVAVGSNAALLRSTARETLICGPAGTGKTRACLEKLHRDLREHPRSRALIARKTRVSLTESALVTFENEVLAPKSPVRAGPSRAGRRSYRYPNGSELVVAGLDQPSRIFSTQYDRIYIQEAIEVTLDDWESLLRAMRNFKMPFPQLFGDTNPSHPKHWLKRRCDEGKTQLLTASHRDNPFYVDPVSGKLTRQGKVYFAMLDQMSGVRRKRLRDGLWAAADGIVYESFDPAIHVIKRFPIPPEWRRFRSIDFGYTNAFVCQWWAVDPDDRMYLYREIYRTKRLVAQHAARIIALSTGERIEATASDHDREDRETLHSAGVLTIPAQKEIQLGIEAVENRLALRGDGKPGLFLFEDALVERDAELHEANKPCRTEDEFACYIYPPGREGKSNKEDPIDADNHGLDALRYAVRYADRPSLGMIWL